MALIAVDPFDQFGTVIADITKYIWVSALLTFYTLVTGRFGVGKALQIVPGANTTAYIPFSNTQTFFCAFSLQLTSNSLTGNSALVRFNDGATTQLAIGLDTNLHLVVYRGTVAAGTLLFTSTNTFAQGTFYRIEIKATIDNAAGTVEIKVNGSSAGWINQSGFNSRSSANSYANRAELYSSLGVGSINQIYDDFMLWDTTGSTFNDFMGDIRIQTALAASAGDLTQFTPSAGSNFDIVNNVPANDAIFVSDSTVGHRDLYNYDDVSAGYTILAVVMLDRAAKSDAGARSYNALVKSGGTIYVGANRQPTTDFLYYTVIYETDPNTGLLWTAANFNSAQFGQEVAA